MDPFILGSLVTAGATAGGAALDYVSARQASKEQMRFQKEMSNTAYQRAVADMQKAGLNPALMYAGGSPATTPVGANAPRFGFGDTFSKSVSSAMALRRMKADLETVEATNARIRADTRLANENALNAVIDREGLKLRNAASAQDLRRMLQEYEFRKLDLPSARSISEIMASPIGFLGNVAKVLNPLTSAVQTSRELDLMSDRNKFAKLKARRK